MVAFRGPKCYCCGIYFDNRSAPDECDGCDGGVAYVKERERQRNNS